MTPDGSCLVMWNADLISPRTMSHITEKWYSWPSPRLVTRLATIRWRHALLGGAHLVRRFFFLCWRRSFVDRRFFNAQRPFDGQPVERMLVLVVLDRHLPIEPRPVHGIRVGIDDDRIQVPDNNRKRREYSFVPVNQDGNIN